VDVKAFLSIKDFDGINIYGRIVVTCWQISFLWADLWADYGQNVEEREEQNTKECDDYLWADEIIYGQMYYPYLSSSISWKSLC
jgi:hypothetical protein